MNTTKLPISNYPFLLLFLSTFFLLFSCKQEPKGKKNPNQEVTKKETTEIENSPINQFPETGKHITDFVKPPYKIQYEAEGFLDNDKLKDIAIVLQDENDKTSSRPTLVLIKQPDGGYKLNEISWVAIGPEYTVDDYRIYDSEDVSIYSHQLTFSMSSIGPNGNKETTYNLLNNQLVLATISTYNMGAGGQSGMDYNLSTGEIDFVEVNTMIDSMPSTLTKKVLKLKNKILFKKDNPNDIIDTIFKVKLENDGTR
ncbi:hypothetical protein [Flavobacterium sp. PS2]|uniref:hypothetical protein n=1 Tax=Flavobacterium sp. PS2 TaxID=3384157 RepID=UPI00390C6803